MPDFEKIVQHALQFCVDHTRGLETMEQATALLKANDAAVHSRLRYAIAAELARWLMQSFPSDIRTFRLYGSTAAYCAGLWSDIDILLQVNRLPPGLPGILAEADRQLLQNYSRLLEDDGLLDSYLLDVHILNEDPSQPVHPSSSYLRCILEDASVIPV